MPPSCQQQDDADRKHQQDEIARHELKDVHGCPRAARVMPELPHASPSGHGMVGGRCRAHRVACRGEVSHGRRQRLLLAWPFKIRTIAIIVFQFLVVAGTP